MQQNPNMPSNMVNEDEDEEFGLRQPWLLLNRGTIDDVKTTIRVLPVQGRGVLLQTTREEEGNVERDPVMLIDKVMVMEYMISTHSEVLDGNGVPSSITRKCSGRELISIELAKQKFQPPKKKGQSNGKSGPYDHLMIIPGVVLTMEQGPANMASQAPGLKPPPPAMA